MFHYRPCFSSHTSPDDSVPISFDQLRPPARLCCFFFYVLFFFYVWLENISPLSSLQSLSLALTFPFHTLPFSILHLLYLPNSNLNTNQYFRILSPSGETTPPCRESHCSRCSVTAGLQPSLANRLYVHKLSLASLKMASQNHRQTVQLSSASPAAPTPYLPSQTAPFSLVFIEKLKPFRCSPF